MSNRVAPTNNAFCQKKHTDSAGHPISLTVHSNGHAVEVDGDGGFFDTVAGVNVNVDVVDGLPGGKY